MNEEKEDKNDDPRFEFIYQYLMRSSKIKPDKWIKMLTNEDSKNVIINFFNTPDEYILTINVSSTGAIVPVLGIQSNAKNKLSYFVKRQPVIITEINYREVLIPGDMSPKPIDDLSVLVQEVYVPILTNPENSDDWPELLTNDVKKHIYDLQSSICQLRGKMTGHTLLSMPMGNEKLFKMERLTNKEDIDLMLKSNIEEIVIRWLNQVNDVLDEVNMRLANSDNQLFPSAEVIFWQERLKNLESIYDQMCDPRVKKIAFLLELTKSSYLKSFETLFKNVIAAIVEARDIYLHLKPLQSQFIEIEGSDIEELKLKLKQLLHLICLAWANSKHYCTTTNIIYLLNAVVNLFITQAIKYLDPGNLFQTDIHDNLIKVTLVLETIQHFRDLFEQFRLNIAYYFKNSAQLVSWTFHEKLVLERLIQFEKRLKQIQNLFEIANEYSKLERIEIAGFKGKILVDKINQVYNEFIKSYNELGAVEYDILFPEDDKFLNDITIFLNKVEEYDKKLASIFDKAFNECHDIEKMIKLIFIIDPISQRPIIQSQLWDNYEKLLSLIHNYLDEIKIVFDNNFGVENTICIKDDEHFPPVAGKLGLLMKLQRHIDYPIESIKLINHPIFVTQSGLDIINKHDEIQTLLYETENKIFTEWSDSVPKICYENLMKPLFVTDNNKLKSNLNPEIEIILKETKYMTMLEKNNLPKEAVDLFTKTQFFVDTKYNIGLIVNWYNEIRSKCSDVEFELLQEEIRMIDDMIDEGQINYNWNSPEIPDYINKLLILVRNLYYRKLKAVNNIDDLMKSINDWAMAPILERKDNKVENLIAIGDRKEKFDRRYSTIERTQEEIKRILDENYKLYFNISPESAYIANESELDLSLLNNDKRTVNADERIANLELVKSGIVGENEEINDAVTNGEMTITEISTKDNGTEEDSELKAIRLVKWKPYLIYIDQLISKALIQAVSTSVCYILDETDPQADVYPLFEVNLCLEIPNISFHPPVEIEHPEGFYGFYEGLLFDIMKMGTLITRLDPDKFEQQEHYGLDLVEDERIVFMLEETCNRVKEALIQAQEYAAIYETYNWIWLNDRQEYLNFFLRYSKNLNAGNESKNKSAVNLSEFKEKKPELVDFKREIDYFIELYNKCNEIENDKILCRWFKINNKLFKQTLLNTICKWSNILKTHLVDHVDSSLKELSEFLQKATSRFNQPILEDDYEGLLKTMYYLKEVRDKQYKIDGMFDPIKETINLLEQYQVDFSEQTHQWLVELPESWGTVKKLAAQVKQQVAPLLAHQVDLIKKRLNYFDYKQQQYYKKFLNNKLFSPDCENVYENLDKLNSDVNELESELKTLRSSAAIHELQVQDYKEINQLRRELKLLKCLWDYVIVITSSLNEWNTTTWKKIDVEGMDLECKKLIRELRLLDKECKSWELFNYIEAQVKNMMSSLRAVSELQNPAIRDRHWQQLMAETRVRFTMTDKTTLEDLLKLELHKYEEEVKNTVDKAVKEMAMEKIIKELTNTWANLEFDKEFHERSKLNTLKISEETIEILEDNQVQLQNMMNSKSIGYFVEMVNDWRKKLSNADAIINIWFDVQRAWIHLESIFIDSEDIRKQLPEDTKRFEIIDRDFKELLKEMLANLNIVKATNRPKLLERLEDLQMQLNICEKALFNYLEMKRLAYPRFYFISSADLLDILSNGNNPELVCKHLSKLYDSISNLKWKLESGKPSKLAVSMIAKDGEEMEIHGVCDCSGVVETWLNILTSRMQKTVRYHFNQAVTSYDEKPREQWILDYPAQPALCGTQIWWTAEVNMAFARLEEGFESALKDYQKKQINQLNTLITILCGELTDNERQKIMTICTIDVHARDVVGKLIATRAENSSNFQWQSQLRHRWDDGIGDCFVNICDANFAYGYEYLGNVPRLVITPLTDRCYITLTQSLHLVMGGAPAGPAGTGKTETTKDLGRALGQMVYVFNCSEQLDYKSCGNIYKGLAQTGAWGCFDEFNRISVEVLSVVAVQVKCVLDGIKSRKNKFMFFGEELNLINTVGMFITMNPGYAGRTELPENLKTLFRPCAMVVPDFDLICEIMLVAEGFQKARLLARKFITLYSLCRELLSKQDHYDWGLRAIKSVLVVAGKLKRDDRQRPEDQVLMRALRDFNTPKIVTDDTPIVQLEELLNVRHSVFIVGMAGTGKTKVWKSLYRTYVNKKLKPCYNDLNPKAVSNDELYGVINPATREWKDGLLSILMRDQANMSGNGPKWIIFDGDIDPMWIESLNTVMDDNKVLTLASNERIALTKSMRLLFEISNLRTATPATVSRAGILYINPQDLGSNPFIISWIETRINAERANLMILFDKYLPSLLEVTKIKFKKITPIPEICHLQMLCNLLDCLLTNDNLPPECPKEWYELYFAFACIWSFGSALFKDQLIDWRNEFSKWWVSEFKTIKFPSEGTVFDYYIDNETKKFVHWKNKVVKFKLDMDIPLQSSLVSTSETARLRFFMDMLMNKKAPVMLVGSAGSGKSVIVTDKLSSLSDNYNVANIPFNYYTSSEMLQRILEKYLEKKAGRNYGPPGTKQLVYFIDDMNMPEVDTYGTVQPHTLIRQHLDYNHWYDRVKLTLKDIYNTQYVSCMNPTAGSFTIDPRLQRHFAVFAVSFPSHEALITIYSQVVQQHFCNPLQKIDNKLLSIVEPLIKAALYLHDKVTSTFLPTATKFHYVFNLRDLSNLFQGYLFANGDTIPNSTEAIRLYVHEASRVYCDKLVNFEDKSGFEILIHETLKKNINDLDESLIFKKPLIYCHFAEGMGDPKYMPIKEWPQLTNLLDEALANYNDLVSGMNLVMFEDAMHHVCRINRLLESPRGSVLLVGVGGSGKQSLSRLASFISGLEVFQVQLKKNYSINDLKVDLAELYLKAGLKSIGITFLMSDSQVAQENFLVVVNDMLASGEIVELFPDDEVDSIINTLRNEVKLTGLMDTRENCWKFFIDRVRKQLKCVLCFSPVGMTLRKRARQFPALVNCTSINWFQDWPLNALESVSTRFISHLDELPEEYKGSVSKFMSFVHTSVNEMSKNYLLNEKRYNYTTPKSFLEQISLYSKLLVDKINNLKSRIVKLENGIIKLESCAGQVDELKEILAVQEVELNKKNEIADKILAEVREENTKAEVEKAIVSEEEARVAEIKERVSLRQKRCDEDLAKAEPAVRQAEAALDTLNKNNLTELKSFGTPPEAVAIVAQAVLVLFSPKGKIPKDRSWKACKAMMGGADAFLSALRKYDKENIHPDVVKAIQPYINDKEFDPDIIYSKSQAAAGLCSWVKNIMVFHYINLNVKPLRAALAQANAELKASMEKLVHLRQRLAELQKELDVLSEKMSVAVAEKQKCQDEADTTALTIDLANRLVNGLASEKIRWAKTIDILKTSCETVPGDMLLATAFISYVGCFTRQYRHDLINLHWIPFLDKLEPRIPRNRDLDILSLLTDDAQIAQWNNDDHDLLQRLSTAGPNILSDVVLVINLETTKKMSDDIEIKATEAKITARKIDEARESYRPAASRASLLYFILNDLYKINMLYQFSLKAFSVVFNNAIKFAETSTNLKKRVQLLIDSITYLVFVYTSRGLFECDKLVFLLQMIIQILLDKNEISRSELDFLLRYPHNTDVVSPVEFLSNAGWGGIKYLSTCSMTEFRNLDRDIEGAAKRWKKFVESETPEKDKFPQEWKSKSALQRLCIMRCLRVDRMTYAIRCFVEEKLGPRFIETRSPAFEKSFEEMSSITPDVEKLGNQLGFTFDKQNFHNVSLGQGQELVAEEKMKIAAANGHWVILQNIHLVKSWLPNLEKKMEQLSTNSNENYRLFMSAEPNTDPHESIIPQGILESAIKITNEPPTGMHANIHKALDNFNQETLDSCTKESEFKGILFALCYFHAVIAERRKFGSQGWNRVYPFNVGDLTISISVLINYLENNLKVPWEDLRYLVGEIMYGGHITDDWDRRLCRTYLYEYLQPDLIDGDLNLAPGFVAPPNSDYDSYHQYIDIYLPPESPTLYGLHPNAEIGFLTATAENLFKVVLEMQPKDSGEVKGSGSSREEKLRGIIEDILDKLPEEFNTTDLMSKVEDRTPFVIVAFQECERMNILCDELRRSLKELELGLKGELTINAEMEDLQNYLLMDFVPPSWTVRAYPSTLGLTNWFADMLNRITELSNWTADFLLPSSVWLGGLFNPQSFLTAIMQQTARKNEWPLDNMCLHCDVMKKSREEIASAPREGAYINGLYMEGAQWDTQSNAIIDARLKDLYPQMPVIYIKAITQDKQDVKNIYECPVYKTKSRGPTYVWTFNLKSKDKPAKWTLAGVAILLQI
ncbi:dynein beta chain, ciliary [Microplitis demolitor]|uniref:dynein beta chain, ciliary n=1 Tax=Microplitis demolitor TaxID=69319 RepID=UPI00235B6C1F|nr:dynein beta chain, ciliary [Microplitis demolitor]